MSRTAITLKFKLRWFPNERPYWAEKLQTDIILVLLTPDADANFGVSLDLDFSTWWRHVKTIYTIEPGVTLLTKEYHKREAKVQQPRRYKAGKPLLNVLQIEQRLWVSST